MPVLWGKRGRYCPRYFDGFRMRSNRSNSSSSRSLLSRRYRGKWHTVQGNLQTWLSQACRVRKKGFTGYKKFSNRKRFSLSWG